MSACLWCDIGQHPFPAGQVGSTQIELKEQVRVDFGGTRMNGTMKDICAACAKDEGFRGLSNGKDVSDAELDQRAAEIRDSTGGRTRRLALPGKSRPKQDAPTPIDKLEAENDSLRIRNLEDKLDDINFQLKMKG